jgi:hypothetical protein
MLGVNEGRVFLMIMKTEGLGFISKLARNMVSDISRTCSGELENPYAFGAVSHFISYTTTQD